MIAEILVIVALPLLLAAWGGLTDAFLTAAFLSLALIPVSRRWELLGSA